VVAVVFTLVVAVVQVVYFTTEQKLQNLQMDQHKLYMVVNHIQ
jgi:hypothetical protein